MVKRVGAKSRDSIDLAVLNELNQGLEESATLSEVLAVDFGILISHVAPDISPADVQCVMHAHADGITKRMDLVATILASHFGKDAANILKQHKSDTVRGWAAFVIGKDADLSFSQKLSAVYSLANDPHFGVREWAWLALRSSIASEVTAAIQELVSWARSESEYIRRFAIESTRPRGVWSKHIPELKKSPYMGRLLLDEVMEDPSRYVQDSCGNWLNDAAKSDSGWVVHFCDEWASKSTSTAVSYIVKRGLRSIL